MLAFSRSGSTRRCRSGCSARWRRCACSRCAPALWRRARGAVLRLLCFAVVLLWLAGPRLVQETREALGDIA